MKNDYCYRGYLKIDPETKKTHFIQNPNSPQLYEVKDLPGVCFIEYKQDGDIYYVIIDKDCVSKAVGHTWCSNGNGYLIGGGKFLHRVIMNENRAQYHVHHRGAKFDNRVKKLQSVHYKQHSNKRAYRETLTIDNSNISQIAEIFQY